MRNENFYKRCTMNNKFPAILPGMALLFFFPMYMMGQTETAKIFFSSDTVPAIYLGIDFTRAKLINDEKSDPKIIQSEQFNGINDLIIHENKKYDVQEAMHRKYWTVDRAEVESRNLKTNFDSLKSSNENDLYRLDKTDIDNLVSHFNYGNHTGYGVLLIVEGMSKTKKIITIWFTIIDINSKKVLFASLVEGKLGSGFGFRNYWASAIKNAIGEVKSDKYEAWKTSAGVK